MIYALDTSTLVYYFRKNSGVVTALIEKSKTDQIVIPPFVYYEMLRGFFEFNAERKSQDLRTLYRNSFKIKIPEDEVMEKAAELYATRKKKGQPAEDADIIIASWCVLADSILVTDNEKHFKDIDGLQMENWKI